MLLGLGYCVEIIRIGTQIDEGGAAVRVMPGNDQDRVFGGAFDGPLGEHGLIISGTATRFATKEIWNLLDDRHQA